MVATDTSTNRFAGDATHWDYAADSSIESRQAEGRKIVALRNMETNDRQDAEALLETY